MSLWLNYYLLFMFVGDSTLEMAVRMAVDIGGITVKRDPAVLYAVYVSGAVFKEVEFV